MTNDNLSNPEISSTIVILMSSYRHGHSNRCKSLLWSILRNHIRGFLFFDVRAKDPQVNSEPLAAKQVTANGWKSSHDHLIAAPRGVHYSNRGFVELGAFAINRLRRAPIITFHAWNAPPANHANQNGTKKQAPDPLRIARYYQSLLDSGKFESRAALARFFGVSQARVTQVLYRLDRHTDAPAPVIDGPNKPKAAAG